MTDQRDPPAPVTGAAPSTQGIKLATDFGPLLVFFAVYMVAGILWATGALMVATIVAMLVSRIVLGHISPVAIVTAVLVLGFGALTLWLNDPRFIKMKPTMVNLLFAAVLGGGLLFGRSLLKLLLGEALQLTAEGWRKLTIRWMLFFIVLAVLNEIVWRNFSETTWASFKVFGILPLTFVFAMLQMRLIERHRTPESAASPQG